MRTVPIPSCIQPDSPSAPRAAVNQPARCSAAMPAFPFRVVALLWLALLALPVHATAVSVPPQPDAPLAPSRATVALSVAPPAPAALAVPDDLPLGELRLPPGFTVELYARVPNARQMALGTRTLFVGSMRAGLVHALPLDDTLRPLRVVRLAEGLTLPAGVAFHKGALYVSAVSRLLRYDRVEEWAHAGTGAAPSGLAAPASDRTSPPQSPTVVRADLPSETHHGAKVLGFGPDGLLYVPVGAPCNICRTGPRHGVILRMRPDGTGEEVFARGVRNTVGFDWHPETRELWFTDNGRDWLGDDLPPDELNHAPVAGLDFGFPYCHGGTIADPEYGDLGTCAAATPPARNLGPHVASLGMAFYTGRQFPAEYRGQVFIAEHGSWNRSARIGYRVTLVRLEGGRAVSYEPFAEGWLREGGPWGRPAALLMLPDGSLLVADDYAGAIYRIRYAGR
ncbi:PQQ-dependent sugar dehydrogenase [Nitratidesulfovibrio liaohensis]|uniref:PQQ-dependent sugar dehydrogenase n=1 Tax=Nitratidesulfovibrio liaohensis TaxID=2604158 RepID=UPI001AAEBB0A|nr:PQQ-dependent sugar dehydrogenase [Nitratidesulfovibrio liaohensis]NHZ45971.1 glucose dehydrogenase [Nitratidesulfovibrio liaohensis]